MNLVLGTDPLEGANLAISILDNFKNSNCLTIATTHYQELKNYALITNGFENASVEFDISTLSPTYKLLVGIPGKSNAFDISRKLGLKEEIIKNAQSLLTKDEINVEELLKSIYNDKSKIENMKEKIQNDLNDVSLLKISLLSDNEQLRKQEKDIINNAKIQARNILLEAKEDATFIIKEMSNISTNKNLDNQRNILNKKIKDIKLEDSKQYIHNSLTVNDIKLGLDVFITTLNQNGTIISNISRSNEVQVQIGSMKMNINIKHLSRIDKPNVIKKDINSSYTSISKTRTAKTEINVIGYNIEEAIFVVDKFLDDCSLAKIQNARIVHGKGTGKLKNGIHQFLKKHPHIKNYRMGVFGEGEMGVTIVELN